MAAYDHHVAGSADQFSDQQMQHMTAVASDYLAGVPPITVSLSKILYHPRSDHARRDASG